MKHTIEFLLAHANPSIRLRVMKEILGAAAPKEQDEWICEIQREPIYQSLVKCQKENGWLGNGFHGPNKDAGPYENQEVGVKWLSEKAVGRDDPVLRGAMQAFSTVPLTDLCYRTKGKYFDEFRYAANGQNWIRCACIARAGYDDLIDIRPQIGLALDSFRRVTEVDSILEITKIRKSGGKEKRVFNDYEKWPCYYSFDLLAHTNSWKTNENIRILADAFCALMRQDRPEHQVGGDSWVGYVLGTIGCLKEGYTLGYEADGIHYTNLERVEWMCRCGLYPYLPQLQQEVACLRNAVTDDGICHAPIDENQLRGLSTYGGHQLEVDWKTQTRRDCDVTFRVLLIMHYAGLL